MRHMYAYSRLAIQAILRLTGSSALMHRQPRFLWKRYAHLKCIIVGINNNRLHRRLRVLYSESYQHLTIIACINTLLIDLVSIPEIVDAAPIFLSERRQEIKYHFYSLVQCPKLVSRRLIPPQRVYSHYLPKSKGTSRLCTVRSLLGVAMSPKLRP